MNRQNGDHDHAEARPFDPNPHSLEAERATIGSLFLDREAIVPLDEFLRAEHFYFFQHALVYQAALDVYRQGTPPDLITIAETLSARGQLNDVGGRETLIDLSNGVPTAYHVEHYAKIVFSLWRKRERIRLRGAAVAAVNADDEAACAAIDRELAALEQPPWERPRMSVEPRSTWTFTEQRYLHDDLVPAGAQVFVFGAPGAGKTFWSIDMAHRVAQAGHRVLYVPTEAANGLKLRSLAWTLHHGDVGDDLFLPVSLPTGLDLTDPRSAAELVALAREYRPALIVVDTLRSAYSGSENDSEHIALALRPLHPLMSELGCTVMYVHHSGHNGDRMRGSSALIGAADTVISVEADEHDPRLITVKCTKQREADVPPPRYYYRRDVPTGRARSDGSAITSCILEPTDRQPDTRPGAKLNKRDRATRARETEILGRLASAPLGHALSALATAMVLDKSNLYRDLRRLADRDLVERRGEGDKARWHLTMQGRTALSELDDNNDNDPDPEPPDTPPKPRASEAPVVTSLSDKNPHDISVVRPVVTTLSEHRDNAVRGALSVVVVTPPLLRGVTTDNDNATTRPTTHNDNDAPGDTEADTERGTRDQSALEVGTHEDDARHVSDAYLNTIDVLTEESPSRSHLVDNLLKQGRLDDAEAIMRRYPNLDWDVERFWLSGLRSAATAIADADDRGEHAVAKGLRDRAKGVAA